jgi:hypothetical protein
VVGGIMTLEPQYRRVLEENNLNARICNRDASGLWGKMESADAIILFTGTVSHGMAIKARKTAASCGIPLITVTRSSVSALKNLMFDLHPWGHGRDGAAGTTRPGDEKPASTREGSTSEVRS